MKKYFEEYGKVIVIAIVILILLALITPIGAKIQENVLNTPVPEPKFLLTNDSQEPKVVIEGPMAKGNIVTIDGKEYRVLEMSDTEAKLLAMYDALLKGYYYESPFARKATYFNGIEGTLYAGSDLDNYLENEFYPSLSFKDAIVSKYIYQNMYEYVSDANYPDFPNKIRGVGVGSRHVYILDVEDIIDYLGTSSNADQIRFMFCNFEWYGFISEKYNPEVIVSTYGTWLRSASTFQINLSTPRKHVWGINFNSETGTGVNYVLGSRVPEGTSSVRPAFYIDLTKCEYTK